MTDKELLELAAKAMGIEVWWNGRTWFLLENKVATHEWNPLTDDGDALRLAVKLGITVTPFAKKDIVSDVEFQFFLRYASWFGYKKLDCPDDDPYSATRRGIVRVAAEIGRDMK